MRKPTSKSALASFDETVPVMSPLGGSGGVASMVVDKEKSIYDVLGWDDDDAL